MITIIIFLERKENRNGRERKVKKSKKIVKVFERILKVIQIVLLVAMIIAFVSGVFALVISNMAESQDDGNGVVVSSVDIGNHKLVIGEFDKDAFEDFTLESDIEPLNRFFEEHTKKNSPVRSGIEGCTLILECRLWHSHFC